jgi:type IV pilus assembly protein PilY1
MKWTAVFGGGFNNGVASTYGAKLFVINMEDGGKIINNIALADSVTGNGIESSVPPTVTAVTADSTSNFTAIGAIVYVSDLEGKLWKVNLTTTGTLYAATKMFNTEATSTNTRYTYQQTTPTLDSNGVLMQYYGTGNMQALGDVSASIANRAYGLKDTDFPSYATVASMSTITNLANVSGGICPTTSQKGWYFNLSANEKISAKATVKNGVVLFPRYTANSTDICSAGSGSISEHSYTCGTALRTTNLGNGVPTEAVIFKNKIYIGISTDQSAAALPAGFTKEGNLIVGDPVSTDTGTVNIESWWEQF